MVVEGKGLVFHPKIILKHFNFTNVVGLCLFPVIVVYALIGSKY